MIFILWLKILNCTIFYIFLKLTGFYRAREWWWIIDETCTCDRIIFFQLAWASIDTFILQTLYFDCYLDFRFFVGFHFFKELFSLLSSLLGESVLNESVHSYWTIRSNRTNSISKEWRYMANFHHSIHVRYRCYYFKSKILCTELTSAEGVLLNHTDELFLVACYFVLETFFSENLYMEFRST